MRRALGSTASVLVVLALAGCSRPSQDPVPAAAESPYVCAGVQEEGARLALGGDVEAERARGAWGDSPLGFTCEVSGPSGTLLVNDQPVGAGDSWGTDATSILRSLSEQGVASKITADAPGDGYSYGAASAGWVCGERFLLVELLDVDVAGRDAGADAERLLVSMLPWACDGVDVPQ